MVVVAFLCEEARKCPNGTTPTHKECAHTHSFQAGPAPKPKPAAPMNPRDQATGAHRARTARFGFVFVVFGLLVFRLLRAFICSEDLPHARAVVSCNMGAKKSSVHSNVSSPDAGERAVFYCSVKQRALTSQLIVSFTFLLLLVASSVLVWVSVSKRDEAIQLALSARADGKQAAMQDTLLTWGRLADQVGRTLAVAPNTTTEGFRFFTGSSTPELAVPELISVSWAIPVENSPEAILAYEADARRLTGCANATIVFLGETWRPSYAEQKEFLPLTQSTFGDSPKAVCDAFIVGFDLVAVDDVNVVRRETVEEARRKGVATATAPFSSGSTTSSTDLGIIQSLFVPVFVEDAFAGLVSAAFKAENLVEAGAIGVEGVFTTLTDVDSETVLSSNVNNSVSVWAESRNLTFGGRTWRLDVVGTAAFGSTVPGEAVWTSLIACILVVVVGALVLARVRGEAILAKATKRLLLQMSHDLRTPLHSMWHAAKEIAELPGVSDNAEAAEPIETLKWCAALAKNILDNILDMSHINMGTLVATNEPDDVLMFVAAAVHIMRGTAEDRGTKLHFVGEQSGPICLVDREKLLRVVLNIIGNAIKFSPGGLVQVRASLAAKPNALPAAATAVSVASPTFVLKVAVQDDGCGMDADTLATATNAYVHTSRSGGGGSGIGLHVAKTIVEQYGGRLKLESPGPGLGCTVSFAMELCGASEVDVIAPVSETSVNLSGPETVELPITGCGATAVFPVGDGSDAVLTEDDDGTTDSGSVDGDSPTIVLVVDDSRMNRRVALHALRPLRNVVAEEYEDGEAALVRLKALAQEAPSRQVLCLMDLSMPKMNGDKATQLYRAWSAKAGTPRDKQAWICLLTGDVVTRRETLGDTGFDAKLTKPCAGAALRAAIATRIKTQRLVTAQAQAAAQPRVDNSTFAGNEPETKVSGVSGSTPSWIVSGGKPDATVSDDSGSTPSWILGGGEPDATVSEDSGTTPSWTLGGGEPDATASEDSGTTPSWILGGGEPDETVPADSDGNQPMSGANKAVPPSWILPL